MNTVFRVVLIYNDINGHWLVNYSFIAHGYHPINFTNGLYKRATKDGSLNGQKSCITITIIG